MKQTRFDRGRAIFAGLVAGTAYLATTWADSKLSSHPFNDLKLVGQVFTTRSPFWIAQGVVVHFSFGLALSLLYASWAYSRLPGPGWFKGLLYLQLENTLLYPIAFFLDPIHAGVRSGQLPRLLNRKTFQGQVLRHVAFGLALGALYRPRSR